METHLDKKFYIPLIEEFHVGFEFELFNPDVVTGEEKWDSWSFHSVEEMKDLKTWLRDGWVRVKHLDRKDIESLGWENEPDAFGYSSFLVEKKDGDNSRDYRLCYISEDDPTSIVILKANKAWVLGTSKWNPIFRGTIKNKSELKKLLKQLGI